MKDEMVANNVCGIHGHRYILISPLGEASKATPRTIFCQTCGDVLTFKLPSVQPDILRHVALLKKLYPRPKRKKSPAK